MVPQMVWLSLADIAFAGVAVELVAFASCKAFACVADLLRQQQSRDFAMVVVPETAVVEFAGADLGGSDLEVGEHFQAADSCRALYHASQAVYFDPETAQWGTNDPKDCGCCFARMDREELAVVAHESFDA